MSELLFAVKINFSTLATTKALVLLLLFFFLLNYVLLSIKFQLFEGVFRARIRLFGKSAAMFRTRP